jgi:hypothetical protein
VRVAEGQILLEEVGPEHREVSDSAGSTIFRWKEQNFRTKINLKREQCIEVIPPHA